jgi:hypothetical protein
VKLAADMLAYYAGETDAPAEEQELPSHIPGKRAKAVRQPVSLTDANVTRRLLPVEAMTPEPRG